MTSARVSGLNPDNVKAGHVSIPTKELSPTDPHNVCARVVDQAETVPHAKSLAAIGQSLEMFRLHAFRLEKTEKYYIVRSDSLTRTHQWILSNLSQKTLDSPVHDQKGEEITMGDGWFCVGPREIVRWSGRERKRHNRSLEPREADNLAQHLGTLGEYLDSKKAKTFEISWAPDLVSVEYVTLDVVRECKDFTVEKLQQLASYSSRFQK